MATNKGPIDISTPRLLAFFVTVVGLQFGYPISLRGEVWSSLYMLGYVGMIYFGLNLVRSERITMVPFIVLAVFTAAGSIWFSLDQGNITARSSMLGLVGLFQFALVGAMSRFLIKPERGTTVGQLILLSISMYLLLGGVFAVVANLLETIEPGSFIDSTVPERPLIWQGMLYYSYVNLSTLGYGDVLPVSPWARSLASFEAVAGTLYLAVVVARLVGAYSVDLEPEDAASEGGSTPSERQTEPTSSATNSSSS